MTTEQAIELGVMGERDKLELLRFPGHPASEIALVWIDRAWALMARIEDLEGTVERLSARLAE